MDNESDQNYVGENLQRGLQAVFLPERKQQYVKKRQAIPEEDGGEKKPPWHGGGTELRDCQFNSKQQCQDEDADPDQPDQPISLIKRRLHLGPKVSKASKFQGFKSSGHFSLKL